MSELACLDGTVMPAAEATVPATDAGLLRGDGVFEVTRLYGGRPFALDDHLRRLESSGANLRLPVDADAVRSDVEKLTAAHGDADAVLRIVLTRGGRRLLLTEPLPEFPAALRLGSVTYAPTRVLAGVKSLSYAGNMLTTRLARERGFDEALLVTPHGRVLEGPTSSFFWITGGELLTPPLSDHILDSITRRLVLELSGGREQSCTLDDVRAADEAFLTSSLREVASVRAVNDIAIAAGGPVTTAAGRRLREHIESAVGAVR